MKRFLRRLLKLRAVEFWWDLQSLLCVFVLLIETCNQELLSRPEKYQCIS